MKMDLLLKLLAPILAVAINLAGFAMTDQTRAFFFERQESSDNTFISDPLSFSVDAADFTPSVSKTQVAGLPAMIVFPDGRDFDLTVSVENEAGDLCTNLELAANSGSNSSGIRSLSGFNYPAGSLANAGKIWYLSASLVPDVIADGGRTCSFDLVFYGEQTGGGYSHRQVVKATVHTEEALQAVETAQEMISESEPASTTTVGEKEKIVFPAGEDQGKTLSQASDDQQAGEENEPAVGKDTSDEEVAPDTNVGDAKNDPTAEIEPIQGNPPEQGALPVPNMSTTLSIQDETAPNVDGIAAGQ